MARRFSRFIMHTALVVIGVIGVAILVSADAVVAQESQMQQLVWVDRSGNALEKIGDPMVTITGVILSPDQKKITFRGRPSREDNDNIWIYDLEKGVRSQGTFHASDERQPCWSPDGKRIVYFSYRNGPANLYMIGEGIIGEQEFLLTPHEAYAPTWSSDNKFILYHYHDQTDTLYDNRDLWYIPADGKGAPVQFTDTPTFKEAMPRFSPDGKYVSYIADETGAWEAYVKPFPTGERVKISVNGGVWPRWNGKGDEIFFWQENTLMAVSVKTSPSFGVSAPNRLFTGEKTGMGPRDVVGFNTLYEIAADGQRFIVVQNSLMPRRRPQ